MISKKINTIIIDDETDGRDVMQTLLEKIPEVQLMAVCDGADSGLESILRLNPELVFLDVQMPVKSGIDVVRELVNREVKTTVVFVTAYEKYAIQAIKLAAFDFLLKPVDPDELHEVIRKFQLKKLQQIHENKLDVLLKQINHENRIRLNTRCGFILVDPSEIIYIQADGNYSEIILSSQKKEIVTQHLGALVEMLAGENFMRASRSCLINVAYLRKVDRKSRECRLERGGETFNVHISRDLIQGFDKIIR
jgi:DNA-binding LytR/AlgR family response regulator